MKDQSKWDDSLCTGVEMRELHWATVRNSELELCELAKWKKPSYVTADRSARILSSAYVMMMRAVRNPLWKC